MAGAEVAIFALLSFVFRPEHLELFLGMGLGATLAMAIILFDSPPHHIERWRQGAEGERATAKALRRIVRDGWTLVHDVDTGRGNIDHILVGPPGVFVLESKNLNGTITVKSGTLAVRWREDPTDGYESPRLAACMRQRAAGLSGGLRSLGIAGVWVQPVVVLWGSFEQRSIESDGVAWVHGPALAEVLAARPTTLTATGIRDATSALQRWLDDSEHLQRSAA
jgi:hypothetical protein